MTHAAKSQEPAPYIVAHDEIADDNTINNAIGILFNRMVTRDTLLSSPESVKKFLTLKFATKEHEVFSCLFLDVNNRLIECNELFTGTLTSCSVYPREVVKAALTCNAAGVILAHNHPSRTPTPSTADFTLTTSLKQALALVDVRVLDHIIVGGRETYSFAEHGNL